MIDNISTSITEPITLAEAKEQIIQPNAADDSYVGRLITVAREYAETYCNQIFAEQSFRLTLDYFPGSEPGWPGEIGSCPDIQIVKIPLMEITSVKYIDTGGTEHTLAPSEYIIRKRDDGVFLVPPYGSMWPSVEAGYDKVKIEFTAGFEEVPEPVKQGMLLIIADLYNNREDSAPIKLETVPWHATAFLDTKRIVVQ